MYGDCFSMIVHHINTGNIGSHLEPRVTLRPQRENQNYAFGHMKIFVSTLLPQYGSMLKFKPFSTTFVNFVKEKCVLFKR